MRKCIDCGTSLEEVMGVMVFTLRDDGKGFIPGNLSTTSFLLCIEHGGNGKNMRKRSTLPKGDE